MRKISLLLLLLSPSVAVAQHNVMTPELLWSLGRVSALSANPDKTTVLYRVTKTDLKTEDNTNEYFFLDLASGKVAKTSVLEGKQFVQWDKNGMYAKAGTKLVKLSGEGNNWLEVHTMPDDAMDVRVSPDGKKVAFSMQVLTEKILAKDIYDDLDKSTAQIYTDLDYRHWDTWNDGKVNHVFVADLGSSTAAKDILGNKPYQCPQRPFGGAEDFIFTADSRSIIYVTKEKTGKAYAQSTNTDLFLYDIRSGQTSNLTEGMMGYDVLPKISPDGKKVAWKSMKRDGYEADKNDLLVMDLESGSKLNLTAAWNETVDGDFKWGNDGSGIYFTASTRGTQQLFKVDVPTNLNVRMQPLVRQMTKGNFNLVDVVVEHQGGLLVSRMDFNHAAELFNVDIQNGDMKAMTKVNTDTYSKIQLSESKLHMVTTKDGKEMGVWVIYPPDFDPGKKYPTLLYCQGGPQSALSQFYSIRWNFQLMAANGYIIVAPNRRGMPGWGVEWNEAISKDWGGKTMQDYLDAIDAIAKEPYVDESRLGCVGASFGGYSVFMLAGMHENRFKTFISHDGLFDMKSWYGTTEELWFANWDLGGNYWDKPIPSAYEKFDPSNYIAKWNTPIFIIQGGKDFRVPIEQGLEAFQAAQLKGLKSKLLYFPNENHWVLNPHNGLAWQREYFKWLKETL